MAAEALVCGRAMRQLRSSHAFVLTVRIPSSAGIALAVRAAPDRFLRPAECGELRGPQRRFVGREELVEPWRRHRGVAQHAVRLATVVDLVLKQMQQQPVHSLALDPGAAMHGNGPSEARLVQSTDNVEQSLIDVRLRPVQRGCRGKGSRSAQAVGPRGPPSIAST